MAAPPHIDSYEFGRIEIDGRTYTSDLILLPGAVRDTWRRRRGHTLEPDDLSAVLEAAPDVLIIGQGAHGCMRVADETLARLRDAGIEAVCAPTAEAVRLYNDRRAAQVVAAAFHLTC